jgi:hypothetical protein
MICSDMSAAAHTRQTDDDAQGPEPWERALLDARLEMLGQLAQMGLELAAAIKDQATPDKLAETGAAGAVAMAFARAARVVRMTLALQSRLIQEFKAVPKGASAQAARGQAAKDQGPQEVRWLDTETERRRRVADIVRCLAEDSGLDNETVERVAGEAGERLEHVEIYGGLMARAVGDLVADICRDLGLHPQAITSPVSLDRALNVAWDFDAAASRQADPIAWAARRGRSPPVDGSS